MRFCILVLLLLPLSAQATVYRCKTPQGMTFQQRPCPENSIASEIEIEDYKIGSRVVPAPKSSTKKKSGKKRKRRRSASKSSNKGACFSKKQQIKKIQWKMRRGYKAGQGAKLRQRRRALEAYMREFCR